MVWYSHLLIPTPLHQHLAKLQCKPLVSILSNSSSNQVSHWVRQYIGSFWVLEHKHLWRLFWLPHPVSVTALPMGRPTVRWLSGKESTCRCRRHKRRRFDPWVGKIHWSRKWQPTPVFLSGKSHGHRSLVGYSPWGCKELGITEWAHTSM